MNMEKIFEFAKTHQTQLIYASIGSSIFGFVTSLLWRWRSHCKPDVSSVANDDAIVITGCDSGLGLALAKHFATNHKFKVICGFLYTSRDSSLGYCELADLANENDELKSRLILLKLDITKHEDTTNMRQHIESLKESGQIKRLAGIINNAGVFEPGYVDWLTWEALNHMIEVNIVGTIRVTKELLPLLIESKGRVVNVTSIVGAGATGPLYTIYGLTKAAITAFSDNLRAELEEFGVKVVSMRTATNTKLTNIVSRWDQQKQLFWESMDENKRAYYSRSYYDNVYDVMKRVTMMTSARSFESSNMYYRYEQALMAPNPPQTIDVMTFWQSILFMQLNYLPATFNAKCSKQIISWYGLKPFKTEKRAAEVGQLATVQTTST